MVLLQGVLRIRDQLQGHPRLPPMRKVLILSAILALHVGSTAADAEEVKLCYRKDAKPFSYLDGSGTPVGYTVEICRRAAAALGDDNPEMVPVTSENRFKTLKAGQCDMLCGATTASLKKRREFEFSVITFVTSIAFLYDSSLLAPGFNEKVPIKVGFLKNTTADQKLDDGAFIPGEGIWNFTFEPVESHAEGARRLHSGELSAYIGDREIIESMVQAVIPDGRQRFKVGLQALSYEPYAIAVRWQDDERRVVIDEMLAELFRTGEINSIVQRYVPQRYRDPTLTYLFQLQTIPE